MHTNYWRYAKYRKSSVFEKTLHFMNVNYCCGWSMYIGLVSVLVVLMVVMMIVVVVLLEVAVALLPIR